MAVPHLQHYAQSYPPLAAPAPARTISPDHVFMVVSLFAVAMIFVGLCAQTHATVERTNRLRAESAKALRQIQQTDRLLARNSSSAVIEQWALAAGFQFEQPPSFYVKQTGVKTPVPSLPTKRSAPVDPFYARATWVQ